MIPTPNFLRLALSRSPLTRCLLLILQVGVRAVRRRNAEEKDYVHHNTALALTARVGIAVGGLDGLGNGALELALHELLEDLASLIGVSNVLFSSQ